MEDSYLKLELGKYAINDQTMFVNSLREIIQKCILVGLSRTNFFTKVAFYGGTCLRIFHNLDRFSEDLDFCIIDRKYASIDLSEYVNQSLTYLNSFGFNGVIYNKEKAIDTSVKTCFIKVDLNNFKNRFGYDNFPNFTSGQLLTIKIEVETNFIEGATYENNKLLLPSYALIKCFDFSSLFSGKINAILNRSWGNRVKGRDYYDFYFYVSNNAEYNLNYIINGSNNIDSKNDVVSALKERFNGIDFTKIRKDVMPFVDNKDLSYIDKEIYLSLLENI